MGKRSVLIQGMCKKYCLDGLDVRKSGYLSVVLDVRLVLCFRIPRSSRPRKEQLSRLQEVHPNEIEKGGEAPHMRKLHRAQRTGKRCSPLIVSSKRVQSETDERSSDAALFNVGELFCLWMFFRSRNDLGRL